MHSHEVFAGAAREAGHLDPGENGVGGAYLWFAPRSLRSVLPAWLAPFMVPSAVFGALTLLDWAIVGGPSANDAMYAFHLVFFVFASVYIARRMERVLEYAESVGAGPTDNIRRRLYSVPWTFATFLVVDTYFIGTTVLSRGFGIADVFRKAVLPGVFHVFIGASGVWGFVCSMKALSDIGHAPLSLKPFTEDRTLGLRPFGIGALHLVALYEVAVLAAAGPALIEWDLGWEGLPIYGLLAIFGLAMFFLPLISFRTKLREAKADELEWIRPRYAELVEAVRAHRDVYVDEKVAGSLSALDKIQKDVEQIRTWPFDAAIATRLATITVLPLMVAVLARELMILTLHV